MVQMTFSTGGMRGPVITAIGGVNIPTGMTISGVTCSKPYLDTGQPTVYVASVHGPYNQKITFPRLAYSTGFTGAAIWMQSAWSDSRTSALKLNHAAMSWIPELSRRYRFEHLSQADPKVKNGYGRFFAPPTHPIMRYLR
jgi:hypothetical protein